MNHERALLSQILQDNNIYYKINPRAWWFTVPEHRAVFNAITDLLTSATTADMINVGAKTKPHLASEIYDFAPTTSNAKYYAELCKKSGGLNELRRLTIELTDKIHQGDFDGAIQGIDEATERILMGGGDYQILSMKDMLPQMVDAIEEGFKNKGQIPGIETGFTAIDELIGGLQKDKLYVIGARPSQGKSAVMINMASQIGKSHTVGILSLESSWKEILTREISAVSSVNSQRLLSGFMTQLELSNVMDAATKINEKKILIYDKPNCSLTEIVGHSRRLVQRHGAEVIFIDYLQIADAPGETKVDRVTRISNGFKALSRELHVPVVALAQLRRDSEGRRPTLADFADSSQIEKDADVAILLYHRVVDEFGKRVAKSKPESNVEKLEIFMLIDKNRDGPTGGVPVYFDAEHVRFKEIIKSVDGN